MTSSKALRAAVAMCFLALSAAPSARAGQPTPEDYATARALYKEGKELRAHGDLKGALEKLKAAHVLGRTPITGIELARTEQSMGLLVEARETCLDVVRMPVARDESKRSAAARVEARELADALRPRLASIRIHLTAASPAVVTVDGQRVPPVSQGEPRLVNPGRHVVTAQVEGGDTVSASIDLAESQPGDVSLSPPAAPQKAPPPPSVVGRFEAPFPPPPAPPPARHGIGALAVAGIVVTSAGFVVGAVGGLFALSGANDLRSNCTDGHCPPAYWNELDSTRGAALASTVGFSVAGAGAVLLVIGLLSHHPHAELREARILPDVGFGTLGARGVF